MPVIDDETLVAYLDGELPVEQVTVVEAGLHRDEQLRHRLQKLQSTWDLLGELPDETPNPDLARSTMELVTIAFERETESWWSSLRKRRLLMLGLALLAAVSVGAVTGKLLAGFRASKLLDRLPTIALVPALENIDSPEWLEMLSQMPNLVEAGEFLIEQKGASGGRKPIGLGMIPKPVNERELWVESLDETDRGRLKESVTEFRVLPTTKQDELHALADYILQDSSQTQRLLKSIRAYHALLYDRDTNYIVFLNLEAPNARAEIVEQLVAGVMCQKYATRMSSVDKDAIEYWILVLQDRYDSELQDKFNSDSFEPLTSFEEFGDRVVEELFTTDADGTLVNGESIAMLLEGENGLSQTARDLLAGVENEGDRRRYLGLWVLSVFGRTAASSSSATAEQLQRAFDELKPEQRRSLELMPERRARAELERRLSASLQAVDVPNGTVPAPRP